MIHYHGLPITPTTVCNHAIQAGHAFVSFAHPDQLSSAVDVAQSFAIDSSEDFINKLYDRRIQLRPSEIGRYTSERNLVLKMIKERKMP